MAVGYGGQRIALVRAAGMVIVVTAGEYGSPDQGVGPRSVIEAVVRAAEGIATRHSQTGARNRN